MGTILGKGFPQAQVLTEFIATLAKISVLCMKNAGTQWTMVSYLKK